MTEPQIRIKIKTNEELITEILHSNMEPTLLKKCVNMLSRRNKELSLIIKQQWGPNQHH